MYTEIIKELIKNQSALFWKVKNGDYSEVCYCEGKDEKRGTYDKNYTNRLRLAYYILFMQSTQAFASFEKADIEDIIKQLFEEELRDRQTNSFQGIGFCLEILTYLLKKYNSENKYQSLFQKAKNANFDCACGYDTEIEIESDLNNCDIYDCIDIAVCTRCLDYAEILVDCWKESVSDWNEQTISSLIQYNKRIDRESENEKPLKKLLAIKFSGDKNSDMASAWKDLIHYYIQFENYEEAYQNFKDMIEHIDFSELYKVHFFKYLLEDCMDLICSYPKKADELWTWAKPFIQEFSSSCNMHGNLYQKSIQAAEKVQDSFKEKLSQSYDIWRKWRNV